MNFISFVHWDIATALGVTGAMYGLITHDMSFI